MGTPWNVLVEINLIKGLMTLITVSNYQFNNFQEVPSQGRRLINLDKHSIPNIRRSTTYKCNNRMDQVLSVLATGGSLDIKIHRMSRRMVIEVTFSQAMILKAWMEFSMSLNLIAVAA
ncbi:hypothetical protein H5410_003849 [Solanum commersonii]|uniref:Uncharacterized protein n=1 Tax=Solanum commersonii TaxID=4109 RepID=A0A9J6B6D1_SOLCO|nr:hypothetical protein H5410_003849 [Solanum commersonii]